MTACAECGREFALTTELQRKRGECERGWLCPTDRFNAKYAAILGFVKRRINA